MKNYLLTYGLTTDPENKYGRAKMAFASPYTIITGSEAYDMDADGIALPENDLYQNYYYPDSQTFVESPKTDEELQGTVWAKKVQITGALETEAVAFPNYYEQGTTLREGVLRLNVPHLSENIFKYMNPNGVSVRRSDFSYEFIIDDNTKLEAVSGNGCLHGETKIGPYKGTLKFNVVLDFTKGQVEGLLHKIVFKSNAQLANIFITNLSAQVVTGLKPDENGYFVYTLPEPKLLSDIGQIRLLPYSSVDLSSNGEEVLYVKELQGIGKTIHNEFVSTLLSGVNVDPNNKNKLEIDSSELDVNGVTKFNNNTTFNGFTQFNSSIEVEGSTDFRNIVKFDSGIEVAGNANFNGDTVLGEGGGVTSFEGETIFNSETNFNGAINFNGTLVNGYKQWEGQEYSSKYYFAKENNLLASFADTLRVKVIPGPNITDLNELFNAEDFEFSSFTKYAFFTGGKKGFSLNCEGSLEKPQGLNFVFTLPIEIIKDIKYVAFKSLTTNKSNDLAVKLIMKEKTQGWMGQDYTPGINTNPENYLKLPSIPNNFEIEEYWVNLFVPNTDTALINEITTLSIDSILAFNLLGTTDYQNNKVKLWENANITYPSYFELTDRTITSSEKFDYLEVVFLYHTGSEWGQIPATARINISDGNTLYYTGALAFSTYREQVYRQMRVIRTYSNGIYTYNIHFEPARKRNTENWDTVQSNIYAVPVTIYGRKEY